MGKSGLATMLLLALAAIIVLLTVSRSTTELADAWNRLAGDAPDSTVATMPPPPATSNRAMTSGDGARQVEQMQQDMERMQELSRSVGQ